MLFRPGAKEEDVGIDRDKSITVTYTDILKPRVVRMKRRGTNLNIDIVGRLPIKTGESK